MEASELENGTLRFTRAGEADLERLLVLARRTFEETFAPVNTADNMATYMADAFSVETFRQELGDPANCFVLAENQAIGSLLGYFKLQKDSRAWQADDSVPAPVRDRKSIFLERFYLDKPFHGKGLAQQMMTFCLALCQAEGYEVIWLGVWEKNARALAFYEKHGFEKVGSHLFAMGSDTQTDHWLMRLLV
ncbi:MAG: N-acetyltransferase [Vampirovibrionales bacterium]|nr:N-acetyltransferase [Vampirovibrionales bacterium]